MYIAKIFWRWDMSLSVRSQIRIYVVSLPENEDRRAHIRAQFDRFALEFEFVDAIVVAKTGGVDSSRIIGHLSPGEVSCLLSHRLVYEKILSSSDETAIVIEDDVIISFEFANFVRNWSSSKFEMSNYVLFLFWAYYLEEDCELVSKFVDNLILKNKQEKFMLKGLEFMTKYAKYLIEHLTNVYKKKSMRKTDKIEFTEKHEGDKNG